MTGHDVTWCGASGSVCSRTRDRRSNNGIPSSSRACWQDVHEGRALVEDLCCRWDSGTGTDRGGWLPREDGGCVGSSAFYRRDYKQTAAGGSPAPPPTTDTVQKMSVENREAMLATEQSAQTTHVAHTMLHVPILEMWTCFKTNI